MTPLIQLEGVEKIYRRSHLGRVRTSVGISDLTLSVEKGEVFGLLGLNGSGKTTTIKMLLGLLRPTKGSIHVLGHAMPSRDVLKQIGYLPEAAYLNRSLTGYEVVTLFARLSQLPSNSLKQTVDSILDKVGMLGVSRKRIGEYSKGMMQRIAMAQALLHDPELLIMDEPLTGLDPLAIQEVRRLVLWLKGRGKTIFLSSHDISEVERLCDRIAILERGKLIKIVNKEEWQHHPGQLEHLFSQSVQSQDAVGPLRFGADQ